MDNAERMKGLILSRKWEEVKEETVEMVTRTLKGMRIEKEMLTRRAGRKEPEDGPVIEAVKRTLEYEWGLYPGVDCQVFSMEDEEDQKLHIVFNGIMEKVEFSIDVFGNDNYSGYLDPEECGQLYEIIKDLHIPQGKDMEELEIALNYWQSMTKHCYENGEKMVYH